MLSPTHRLAIPLIAAALYAGCTEPSGDPITVLLMRTLLRAAIPARSSGLPW